MNKLEGILNRHAWDEGKHLPERSVCPQCREEIKALMLELIGEPQYRETTDMSLQSWTPEDYKAFGKNELIAEIKAKVAAL